jgi:poly-gamma-glutamate capsule biosynthesis protein CapA/YwtB (metallophosphatase superfamily)
VMVVIFFFTSWVHAVTLQFVGDVLLGTDYPVNNYVRPIPSQLDSVKALIKGSDLLLGNYEGCFCETQLTPLKCKKNKACYAFKLPVSEGEFLKKMGFHYLSHANNHAYDFEPECLKSTLETFHFLGIKTSGLRNTFSRFDISGLSILVISFHASEHFNSILDLERVREKIHIHRKNADFIVVFFHGGGEGRSATKTPFGNEFFLNENRGDVRRFARLSIDSGADIVVGSGPHVIRGMEMYKGKMIAYSLGDFIFPIERPDDSYEPYGISLKVKIEKNKKPVFNWVSFKREKSGWPVLDPSSVAHELLKSRSQ